jgi:NADH dehydrogenase
VAASPLARSLGVPLDRAGRVRVEPDLTIPGRDDVYVIGDLAYLEQDGAGSGGKSGDTPGVAGRQDEVNNRPAAHGQPAPGPKPIPGVAPAAMQMGRHAAENIRRT